MFIVIFVKILKNTCEMKKNIIISSIILFTIFFGFIYNGILNTGGRYIYYLDDAYIHLSIAKNIVYHNVWGVTPFEFSSSSSSPLYTLILSAIIYIFGDNEYISLYLNSIAAIVLIVFLVKYYSKIFEKSLLVLFFTLMAIFATVLYGQMLNGMEHTIQLMMLCINFYYLTEWRNSNYTHKRSYVYFLISISLLPVLRLEMLFYVFAIAILLFLNKKFKQTFVTFFLGTFFLSIFCLWNYSQSSLLMPFSVIAKGNKLSFEGDILFQIKKLLDKNIFRILFLKVLFIPLITVLVLIFKTVKDFPKAIFEKNFNNFLFLMVLIAHLLFADIGYLRYESYLMLLFSLIIAKPLFDILMNSRKTIFEKAALFFGILLIGLTISYKNVISTLVFLGGSKDIYDQQIQNAKFINKYYKDDYIVANDIGAICYYNNIHLLDIMGLASAEVLPYRAYCKEPDEKFQKFLQNKTTNSRYKFAIIYDVWLQPFVPNNWIRIADFKIKKNYSACSRKVSFYAFSEKEKQILLKQIEEFNWNKDVEITIYK